MFNKFRVVTFTRNMSDGEATFSKEFNTEKEAMDKFYADCNSYGTNPQTKTCEVVVFNPEGNISKMEMIDNSKYIVEEPGV